MINFPSVVAMHMHPQERLIEREGSRSQLTGVQSCLTFTMGPMNDIEVGSPSKKNILTPEKSPTVKRDMKVFVF